jgi:excisionase family DNA binding protein
MRTIENNSMGSRMKKKSISLLVPPADRFAYRVPEACMALGIGRTSLYELVRIGELKLIKIAGRTLVPRSELERLTSVERPA